jgi:hypothetical protein
MKKSIHDLISLFNQQCDNESLWVDAETSREKTLQEAIIELHIAIEAVIEEEFSLDYEGKEN